MTNALIYGLVDPRTMDVRYVGKAVRGLGRARQHRCPTSLKAASAKNAWLTELFSASLDYEIVVLEQITEPAKQSEFPYWKVAEFNTTALGTAERWWIALGRSFGWSLTNATDGGDGRMGVVQSATEREKHSVALRGRKHTPEHRAKNAAARRGRRRPDVSAALKGRKRPLEISAMLKARKASPETRAKMAAKARGRVRTIESREKQMRTVRAKKLPDLGEFINLNHVRAQALVLLLPLDHVEVRDPEVRF